jgi:fatty-acyl-CoA synthase
MSTGAADMMTGATRDDVVYCAMPLFHANAQILALGMSLAVPCGLVLARRFSKSRFLDDVRRYGCTLFNYVGCPLAYLMDTPVRPDDAEPAPPRVRNEGPRQYLDAFAARFGCRASSTATARAEVGVSFSRGDDDPRARSPRRRRRRSSARRATATSRSSARRVGSRTRSRRSARS